MKIEEYSFLIFLDQESWLNFRNAYSIKQTQSGNLRFCEKRDRHTDGHKDRRIAEHTDVQTDGRKESWMDL